MSIIQSLFEQPSVNFEEHLSINDNNRILFSGRFGIGKTTFIDHFFKENKSSYFTIHLFPVNYSVLDNEDIFSYIKYDILVSLLNNSDFPLKEDYYGFVNDSENFVYENLGQIIATLLLLIPKFGKQLSQFTREIKQLSEDFEKYKLGKEDKLNKETNSFLMQFHNSEGGIYETNVITSIIQNWILEIRETKSCVLVIDDLDRIDPAHIFRLLNVFSSNLDIKGKEQSNNKFGFSKIIFVCDVNNLKSIFKSRYGINTDFNGYIDKFYSKEIFKFDNTQSIIHILDNVIDEFTLQGTNQHGIEPKDHLDKAVKEHIKTFLFILVINNKINLRALLKLFRKVLKVPNSKVEINRLSFKIYDHAVLVAIYVLAHIFGDYIVFKNRISELNEFIINERDNPSILIGNLVSLLNSEELFEFVDAPHLHEPVSLRVTDYQINNSQVASIEYSIWPYSQQTYTYQNSLNKLDINSISFDVHFKNNEELDIKELVVNSLELISF